MLAGRASEPDNAIGKFKQDALDWIVNQGASTNSSAGQLSAALAYGLVDVFAPEGYGGAALMVGGAALGAGARAVRGLDVGSTAAMRSEAAANIWEARQILRETQPNVSIERRNGLIKSFELETFRVRTIDSDLSEFRYFDGLPGPDGAAMGGRWSTPQWIESPAERISILALPSNQATRAASVTYQSGTTLFQGAVAPQLKFGPSLTGGGLQTYNAVGPRAITRELP
jgi:hypothetical protein